MPAWGVKGCRLHYLDIAPQESLPALVFIHGAGGSHRHWLSLLPYLPRCRQVLLDLPGHGRSGGQPARTVDEYAQTIVRFLAGLQLHSYLLVGHSLGGAIILAAALARPEGLKGLVLMATAARLPRAGEWAEIIRHPGGMGILARSLYGTRANRETLERAEKDLLANASLVAADFAASQEFDVTKCLAKLTLPSLVMVGEEDRLVPFALSASLEQAMPQASLIAIPGVGHMLQLENPREVAAPLAAFWLTRAGQRQEEGATT